MQPETRIRLDIVKGLKMFGFGVWDMEQNRKTRQTPGFSDLVAIGHGWIIFLEVKAKTKQSPAQIVFGDEVNGQGIRASFYIVVHSMEETVRLLMERGVLVEVSGAIAVRAP